MKYHRLTLAALLTERAADGHKMALWRCDCGEECRVALSRVKNGYTKSCGCLIRESGPKQTHGMWKTPEYGSWQAMKWRCLDPNNKDYPRWGALGITVCDRWIHSFEAFFEDMGPRPLGTTLDRIDNTKGYEPTNCRWATHAQQQSNRRDNWTVEIDGDRYTSVQAAARSLGVSDTTIARWCNKRPNCRRWRTYAA